MTKESQYLLTKLYVYEALKVDGIEPDPKKVIKFARDIFADMENRAEKKPSKRPLKKGNLLV